MKPMTPVPTPFPQEDLPTFIRDVHGQNPHALPGSPEISLGDRWQLYEYLSQDLLIPDLDGLSPWLWIAGGARIAPLTEHIFRNRKVGISENPQLHMVIDQDRAFLKPIPVYLFSWVFWERATSGPDSIPLDETAGALRRAAIGLLRSYFYLIRRRSDFILAKECRLLPEEITYEEFSTFIKCFSFIPDSDVPVRYGFGYFYLSRLNFLGSVFLRSSIFHLTPNFVIGSAFVFGFLSLILSAMQVILAALAFVGQGDAWGAFARVATYFSVTTLVMLAIGVALFLSYLLWSFFYWIYGGALAVRSWRRGEKRKTMEESLARP